MFLNSGTDPLTLRAAIPCVPQPSQRLVTPKFTIFPTPTHLAPTPLAHTAFQLKRDTPERLAAIDALIAACAKVQDAILVHPDPHIAKVPARLLKQEVLSRKISPTATAAVSTR